MTREKTTRTYADPAAAGSGAVQLQRQHLARCVRQQRRIRSEETDDSAPASAGLPATFEIAAIDPHYRIATPDWYAEGYGCGFALNEKGNKAYAIVAACGAGAEETPLAEAFSALYNDTFNGA